MTIKPTSIDDFIATGCGRCKLGGTPGCKVHHWTAEIKALREILCKSALDEQLKWSQPCYTHNGQNIVIIAVLKQSIALSWLAGAQFSDPNQQLEKPGEHSNHVRYQRFFSLDDIDQNRDQIDDFLTQALSNDVQSAKKPVTTAPASPTELITMFDQDPEFKKTFESLTPGRQRSWLLHFSAAKQSQTRQNRIEKAKPKILEGKGWNER
ncbi:MAG: YdeI/OmpD-associated family protein [Gammaproteobacteria bacterium]|nr:YdeI/OmpD-associated family protein [Gammaproteobacteria bacterium]